MKDQNPKELAAKIAELLEAEPPGNDLTAVFSAIEEIVHRLDKLEASTVGASSTVSQPLYTHPSLDRLNVAEAIASSIFDDRYKEKACQFERDKPCDHCSMCSSRGF